MSCSTKIVTDIINSCRAVKGLKPFAYWVYRKDVVLTFSDNEITTVVTPILGTFNAVKFGLNAGNEATPFDDKITLFKHKFSSVVNAGQIELDEMDDIVVFVQTTDGVWLAYGADYGLWKVSQVKMSNDNVASIAIEFASREGMEENYSEYVVTADLSAIPNTYGNEVIRGLSIANGGAMYIEIDSEKSGTIIKPDGTFETFTGELLATTWTGTGGEVTILIDKTTELFNIAGTEFTGNMNFVVGSKNEINLSSCNFITAQCDYILDQLIANGTVTGTHTIDFSGNLEIPTLSKVTDAEALGWTVTTSTIEIGDTYGGGRVVFVDGTQILIACTTVNGDLIEITESSDYAVVTTDFITAFNNTIRNGYDDWRLPTLTEGLLLIENTVEQIITDGTLNEVAAYADLWWTSTNPSANFYETVNWDGATVNQDSQEDVTLQNGFAIRKVTL